MAEWPDKTKSNIYLSIVVPMYNEEENVASTVEEIHRALEGQVESYEIVLVNDGSTDNTLEAAQCLGEADERVQVTSYAHNGGRGKALRTGFANARGEIVASIDADLSYAPEVVLEFLRVLREDPEVDLVLASPYMEGGRTEGVAPFRLFVSRLGNVILSAAMPGGIQTSTCIVRGYRREVLDSLELESDGKEIHLEILSKALALGYRAKEIPAVLRSRTKGRSKFRFRLTALSHLLFTFLEKPLLLFGLIGMLFLLLGLVGGSYLIVLWRQQALNPDRPLMTLMVLLIVTGVQVLSFGFIGTQLMLFKKEIYRIQKGNRDLGRKLDRVSRRVGLRGED
jgi:dolichol-phosphate mannosyltransferase